MIERRITSRIDILTKDIWGRLLPANAFVRMYRHSYGRPREAIRLVSLCIAEAQRKQHLRVEEEDLDRGIRKFSDARIAQIASEFSHNYSGLDPVIRKLSGWPKEFPVQMLKDVTEEIWLEAACGEDIAKEYPWAHQFGDTSTGFAKALLECGILLYKADRTVEPAMYDMEKRPDVTTDTWVAIHPVFWPGLGIA